MSFFTAGDYFRCKKVLIGPTHIDSVKAADHIIEGGEKVNYALLASVSFDKKTFHPAAVVVTTHRLLCVSCAPDLLIASLPYKNCIGIGDAKGRTLKQLPIHCDDVAVSIQAPAENIPVLRESLLSAIELSPNQAPIEFSSLEK